jgi:hypothetical protein
MQQWKYSGTAVSVRWCAVLQRRDYDGVAVGMRECSGLSRRIQILYRVNVTSGVTNKMRS